MAQYLFEEPLTKACEQGGLTGEARMQHGAQVGPACNGRAFEDRLLAKMIEAIQDSLQRRGSGDFGHLKPFSALEHESGETIFPVDHHRCRSFFNRWRLGRKTLWHAK
jgi:hypothetical protein